MNKKLSILYVEDYPVIQDMYVDVLKKHGFGVDVANDGKEATTLTEKKEYDIILLDLLLPHVSGIEFLRRYRKGGGKAKIIVLTDFDDPKTVAQVEGLNVDNYWMKVENTPHLLAKRIESLTE